MSINQQVKALFDEQTAHWPLARTNFEGLKTVQTKSVSFGDYDIRVQFNPARIVSSGAKVDAKTIAERKCFLCAAHRPVEQRAVDFGDYEILVNPFPIFPEHFTIPRKEHVDQQINPFFADMLRLAQAMDNYLVFYNGPRCGASAPDHMHFQAGTKDYLPLVNDYFRLKDTHTDLLVSTEKMQLFGMKNYGRTVYVIESSNIENAQDAFEKLHHHLTSILSPQGDGSKGSASTNNTNHQNRPIPSPQGEGAGGEVMMNIVCTYTDARWQIFVLPRKAFRPWQYTAEGEQQLLISPATVEMCGVFITPIEAHFNRIGKADIQDILGQIS